MNGHKSNDNLVMMSQTARIAPHASRRAWALFLVFADGSKQQEKSLCLEGTAKKANPRLLDLAKKKGLRD